MRQLKLIVFIFFFVLAGCQTSDRFSVNNQSELVIGAAASLQDVTAKLKDTYQQRSGNKIVVSFASSGTLQRQIEQGAPIDIFISADRSKIDSLAQDNLLIEYTIQNIASNQIALITQNNSNKKISSFSDLSNENVATVAIGEPNTVPGGKYAVEVLDYYGIANEIANKTVYGKDIRQVLNYVVTQNADVGIVYLTDALNRDDVEIVEIAPTESHSNIQIAIAQVAKNQPEAKSFLDFVLSSEGKKILQQFGFIILTDNK